jgi:uncharacterized membrane protein required for colicin V production
MFLDVSVIILLIVFTWSGYVNGAFVQLVQLGLILGSFILAWMASGSTANGLGRTLDVAPRYAGFVGLLILWFLVYLVARLSAAGILRAWKDSRVSSGGFDRYVGALLGFTKASVAMYCLLSTLVLANRAVARVAPGLWVHYKASRVGRLVERHNLFEHVPDARVRAIGTLTRIANDQDLRRKMADDPATMEALARFEREVMSQWPALRSVGRDPTRLSDLALQPEVLHLLDDPRFLQLLDAIDALDEDP